jgi:hypothetical protein
MFPTIAQHGTQHANHEIRFGKFALTPAIPSAVTKHTGAQQQMARTGTQQAMVFEPRDRGESSQQNKTSANSRTMTMRPSSVQARPRRLWTASATGKGADRLEKEQDRREDRDEEALELLARTLRRKNLRVLD